MSCRRTCVWPSLHCCASVVHSANGSRQKPEGSYLLLRDLTSLTQEVGGDKVRRRGGSPKRLFRDPHFVRSQAQFSCLKLRHADLLILVGLDLEDWLVCRH